MTELCSDVPKAGLLLGLVPRPYASLFTTQSNTHDLQPGNNTGGFMERVAWVDPTGGDKYAYEVPKPVVFLDAFDLIKMVLGLHRYLFLGDGYSPAKALHFDQRKLRISSSANYTCETVADLWLHLQNRVQVMKSSLPGTIHGFVGLVEKMAESPLVISNCAEMKLQYRLRGLSYKPEDSQETVPTTGVFQNWRDVPREVCIVLTVPRDKLEPLSDDKEEQFSPRLVCTIRDPSKNDLLSTYTCIHAAWGWCIPLDESWDRFAIEEDFVMT
ncbi:hypothetical protein FRC12_008411 [Ceratobasidium sp. 428]|nr:hypothetical protein FRC12_008411 [Ceratobasidium sp. 428]